MNKFIEQANDIIPKLRDKENEEQADAIKNIDPFFALKASLFSFFKNILLKVQEEDEFKIQIKQAILEKIDSNEVEFDQLASLLRTLNDDNQDLMDSILSIFKPAPSGQISPLIEPLHGGADLSNDAFKDLRADERAALDMLTRVLDEAKIRNPESEDTE